jgi:hypothetical protein
MEFKIPISVSLNIFHHGNWKGLHGNEIGAGVVPELARLAR